MKPFHFYESEPDEINGGYFIPFRTVYDGNEHTVPHLSYTNNDNNWKYNQFGNDNWPDYELRDALKIKPKIKRELIKFLLTESFKE